MTDATTATPTTRAYNRLSAAIQNVTTEDATPLEMADALMALSIDMASTATDDRTIARALMGIAERLLGGLAAADAPGEGEASTARLHASLEAAAQTLVQQGHPAILAAGAMLAFSTGWLARLEGTHNTAERLYSLADSRVANAADTRH